MQVDGLQKFTKKLEQHFGLYFGNYHQSMLYQLLEKRAYKYGKNIDQYLSFLDQKTTTTDQEWQYLLHQITIKKTEWFRNPPLFQAFTENILPSLLQKKAKIAIWSAGCATGQEVYSIWFAVAHALGSEISKRLYLLATDIDKIALQIAKDGIYKGGQLAALPNHILKRWFLQRDRETYQVSPSIRKQIQFCYHNLLQSPYPKSPLGQWDVIFCRNVLIYFSSDAKKRVLHNFAKALNEGGCLCVGYAEHLRNHTEMLQPHRPPQLGVFIKIGPKVQQKSQPASTSPPSQPKPTSQSRLFKTANPATLPHWKTQKTETKATSAMLTSSLEQGLQLTMQQLYIEAIEVYEKALEADPLAAEAYIGLAFCLLQLGQHTLAETITQKVIYLHPKWSIGYMLLGEVCRQRGESQLYQKYMALAQKYSNPPDFREEEGAKNSILLKIQDLFSKVHSSRKGDKPK